MAENAPQVKYLKDYRRPDYSIQQVDLCFDLQDHETLVTNRMHITRTMDRYTSGDEPLVLDGEELKLIEVKVDTKVLNPSDYQLFPDRLVIPNIPEDCWVEIKNIIDPLANKTLEGLYKSGSVFCTQNEPEGMRRITYFIDRSDVMARYTTKIIADKKLYPVMLSNGNLIDKGDLKDGRHFNVWQDPFPKPSYLFALVAGDLGVIQDTYKTSSGRMVDLRIYCDKGRESRCQFAMLALKQAMQWDEERFGLEYDLDIYMIVAVDAFNMGAMENKGLNIFNSSCVLANTETSTDYELQRIQGIIGHEYFHNWTGNRITCRDWFQLTLKEGLTVYRDQEFSADMNHKAVQRIQNVRNLRLMQFSEDASPMSHPIRPESYMEINNFYTLTIYEKGAEVIRMIETLIGRDNFRKGMDRYFELYDGQAVTTENFVHAMELVSGVDLTHFKRSWYSQAGTPEVNYTYNYSAKEKELTLTFKQNCPPTPEAKIKEPYVIPLELGFIDKEGRSIPVRLKGELPAVQTYSKVMALNKKEQSFVFTDISSPVLPSVNRHFSAPIRLKSPHTLADWIHLAAYEADDFNRWDSWQEASKLIMNELIDLSRKGKALTLPQNYIAAFGQILGNEKLDASFRSLNLSLPITNEVAEEMIEIDYHTTHNVREWIIGELAKHHEELLWSTYKRLGEKANKLINHKDMGERALKNSCLSFLTTLNKAVYWDATYQQYCHPLTMTDQLAAFKELVESETPYREKVLQSFYQQFADDSLVLYKWFAVQSSAKHPQTLKRVKELTHDKGFDILIPNSARSLLHTFSRNVLYFHDISGEGYRFIAEKVLELDSKNHLVASTLVRAFAKWRHMDAVRKNLMQEQLKYLIEKQLSKNVYEIVHNYLHS